MSFMRRLDVVTIYAGSERAAHPAGLHYWSFDMKEKSKVVFVGLDLAKDTLAVADEGRDGEILDWGTVSSAPQSVEKLLKKLAARFYRVEVCYEADPTGYGLYRQITAFGWSRCVQVRGSKQTGGMRRVRRAC